MATLGNIEAVNANITNGKAKSIKVLYIIVFGDDLTRLNRNKLKKFSGFPDKEGTEFYNLKLEQMRNMNLADLISVCHILNINYEGTSEELSKRILFFLCYLKEANTEDEEDVEEVQEDEDESSVDENNDVSSLKNDFEDKMKINNDAFFLNFRDVEDSIRRFNGKDGYPISRWLEEFEEIAQLMHWNDLQKLIFAKKSLDGLAKLLVQAEKGITSWLKLKLLLHKEFTTKVSSADIHKLLTNRKKRKEETVQEYVLVMREIGSRASIESEVIIQYIIDGIPDEQHNKIILYGASNFEELKKKVKLYDSIKSTEAIHEKKDSQMAKYKSKIYHTKNKDERRDQNDRRADIRCYSCGDKGHRSNGCPHEAKGVKCFKCNKFGHIAAKCPNNRINENKNDNVSLVRQKETELDNGSIIIATDKMHKQITIGNKKMLSLIDTGSDLNIITDSCFNQLNSVEVKRDIKTIQGLGCQKSQTLGKFETIINIDDEEFFSTVHIVPDGIIPVNFIIGKELLNNAEVIINNDGLKIKNICVEEENFLLSIKLHEQEEEMNNIPEDIRKIINDYCPKATKSTNIETKIILTDELPIYQHPRRLSMIEKKEVNKQIDEWLQKGIIRPSNSDFTSPIVLVKKKNGDTRICVDYRKINKKILKDRYPLPLIEDQIDGLHNAKIFSTLDCENGFFHVPVSEDSIKYTSFVTPNGQYEFLKTPFGMCNSPASFQRFICSIFKDLINQGIVMLYMDDLIIPANNRAEAIERLKIVLNRASEYGLKIKWKKCQFLQSKIEYLGYEIEDNKIKPSKSKTNAVTNYPKPTTLKQIHSFLGLTGYFRKFIKDYAQIAKPLSDLLKKNKTFVFGPEQENSFNVLKRSLAEKPVLQIYNPNSPTELHTDASKYGYGSILLQKNEEDGCLHPVYYFSKKTTEAEQNYTSYELEVLAIIESVKKFRVYLLGIEFKIVTDCSAFTMTMKKKDLTTRVARWALLLEEYSYTIEHRKGERMKHADALSRNPITLTITTVTDRFKTLQQEDGEIQIIMKLLNSTPYENYIVEHGLLYKEFEDRRLLVVPKKMQIEIIKKAHECGHFSIKKTEEIILREYWINKLKEKITNVIKNCIPCILAERKRGKQEGYLNPIDKGDRPLDTYHIDHLGPLSMTGKGYKYILAVVDGFTKFVWLYATKSTTSQETISKLEIQAAVFGNPRRIISDRGTAFSSNVFEEYCRERDIEHIQITTGVPRGNGQVERVNQIIIPTLTKLSIDKVEDWYKHVNKVQVCLNNTFQRSIKSTLFEIMIGVKMRTPHEIKIKEIINEEYMKLFQEERDVFREAAKEHIAKIQEENKKTFNKKRKPAFKYKIGDWVAIKRSQFATMAKIKPKFLGPYEVTSLSGCDRYEVSKRATGEGPKKTTTCADQMKPWCQYEDPTEMSSEADDEQDGRDVGTLLI